jgi:hypothetical protein
MLQFGLQPFPALFPALPEPSLIGAGLVILRGLERCES